MKRFLTSLGASLALIVGLLVPAVSAESSPFWDVQMYKPTASSTAHTLNVEYTVLSTETDTFDVQLFEAQNGGSSAAVASQHIDNSKEGDSGVFNVTLVDGTYSFHVSATNHGDGDSVKVTDNQTVTVTTEPSGGTTVVFVNNGTGGQGGGTTGTATGGQVLGTQTTGTGTATGTNGQVNAPGSSKTGTNRNNGKVLGVETTNNHTTRNTWIASVAAGLALLLALYYWLVRRANTNR